MLKRFIKDEGGATAIEYGLMSGLIFLAICTALYSWRDGMQNMYTFIGTAVLGATH